MTASQKNKRQVGKTAALAYFYKMDIRFKTFTAKPITVIHPEGPPPHPSKESANMRTPWELPVTVNAYLDAPAPEEAINCHCVK